MLVVPVPENFRPEDYGWEVSNPIVPHQQLASAMQELHHFGFVSTQYSRWQIPFRFPAVLTIADYDADTRQYKACYMPPFEWHTEKVSRPQILEEIRWGIGSTSGSPARPFVSLPEK